MPLPVIPTSGMPEAYQLAYRLGWLAADVISRPVGTQGHTFGVYLGYKSVYEDAIYADEPTDDQMGFADGFDAYVVARKRGES
jgi:threonine synthase